MMVNTLRKFKEMKLKGGITKEEILKESESIVVNELKGKGNVNIDLFYRKRS